LTGISVTVSYLIEPYGEYEEAYNASLVGITLVIMGILTMCLIVKKVFQKRIFKAHLAIANLLAMVAFLSLIPLLATNNILLVSLGTSLLGASLIPTMPVLIELAIEYGFPI